MREGQLCLVMFVVVLMENLSTDSLSFWVADLAQVSITNIHANAMNALQLIGGVLGDRSHSGKYC